MIIEIYEKKNLGTSATLGKNKKKKSKFIEYYL